MSPPKCWVLQPPPPARVLTTATATTTTTAPPQKGVVLRVIITFLIMFDRQYTWKERLFYAVAWTPKATVQASLSAVPLAMIQSAYADSPDFEKWSTWGEEILTTGVFAIIFCGSLGTLLVYTLAPVLLNKGEVGDGGALWLVALQLAALACSFAFLKHP